MKYFLIIAYLYVAPVINEEGAVMTMAIFEFLPTKEACEERRTLRWSEAVVSGSSGGLVLACRSTSDE